MRIKNTAVIQIGERLKQPLAPTGVWIVLVDDEPDVHVRSNVEVTGTLRQGESRRDSRRLVGVSQTIISDSASWR